MSIQRGSMSEHGLSNELRERLMSRGDEASSNEINYDKYFLIRTSLIVVGLVVVVLNTFYGFILPHGNVECLQDMGFEATAGINKYLAENQTPRHLLIALSSLCVDFVIIYMSVSWICYGRSWRVLFSLGFFYMFRGFVQNLFQMKFPEGYLWEYPSFPSIMVSYLKTNDFFFSGHVGFPIIIALEFQNTNNKYMMIFCLLTCVFEAFTMIVTRGHYIIDLITGIVVAHWVYMNVEKYIYIVDNSFMGMTTKVDNQTNLEERKDVFKPVEIQRDNNSPNV